MEINTFTIIGGSMIGNLVVWIVGVLLAYLAHDEDHHYPQALTDKRRAEARMHASREKIQKPLRGEFQRIEASGEKAVEQARRKHEMLQNNAEMREGREVFARLRQQDARVLSVLEAYRMRLVDALRGSGATFETRPELAEGEAERLTPDQYAARPFRLNYL
ncbi:hypothetical protein [Aurantimonas sp. Leaf443]|uniref:hypothetical protein n=1 Tax=Aurantimonas sp. Leaf443 TaxID=1736378 RepID=UPI0006FE530D|nr:hypothetical protein [Aurantimonas sp. Leaf443]KQT87160.1 hypothetical protein ASG48_17535 [Aurantimonas sp. Leaf443]